MPIDYNSDTDLPDQAVDYMNDMESDHSWAFANRSWLDGAITSLAQEISVPANGSIMEAGVWKGKVYNQLKNEFGADRCVGYDIHDYGLGDSSVTIHDFRTLDSSANVSLALFYNGMGGWDNNGSSKEAGLDYAYNNLVSGGYYVDVKYLWEMDSSSHSPEMSNYPGMNEVVVIEDQFKVYQKV